MKELYSNPSNNEMCYKRTAQLQEKFRSLEIAQLSKEVFFGFLSHVCHLCHFQLFLQVVTYFY